MTLRIALLVMILCTSLDYYATTTCYSEGMEANPLIAYLISILGVHAGVAALKVMAVLLVTPLVVFVRLSRIQERALLGILSFGSVCYLGAAATWFLT